MKESEMDIEPLVTDDDGMSGLLSSLGEAPEQSTEPVGAEPPTTDDPEAQEEGADEQAEEAQSAAEDVVDLDGHKIAVPKGTPKELVETVQRMAADLKADHTRKTQAIAERDKDVQQQQQLMNVGFEKMVAFREAQGRLQRYGQIDWQQLADSDPAQATRLMAGYQVAKTDFERASGELQQVAYAAKQTQQAQSENASQYRQRLLADGMAQLPKLIPGYDGKVAKAIADNTKSYGYTDDELAGITDPRLVAILYDAQQWKKLQAAKPVAMKKVAEAPRAVRPGATQRQTPHAAAADRLRKFGRVDDLADFLG